MSSATTTQGQARFSTLSRIIGMVVVAVALLVVVGWVIDLTWLKSISPHWVAMKVNTAVCFILLGVSLALLANESTALRRRQLAKVCAFVVVVISLLTLAEYGLSANLGMDEWLLRQPLAEGVTYPGRMSTAAAGDFLLLGLALLLLDWKSRRGRHPAPAMAMVAALVGLFAITGYLFGVKSLYALSPFSTMAAHTAVLFFVLSLGVLLARPAQGPLGLLTSESIGGAMTRRLFAFTIIVPLLLGWLRLEGEQWGYYNAGFGLALYATINILVLALLLWLTALWLNRNDALRRQAELAAEESRGHLGGIIESAMDAIISVDATQKIVLFNHAAEKMFRCPVPTALGQPLGQFLPERLRADYSEHFQALGQTGETARARGKQRDLIGLRATGEEFPLEASISQTAVGDKKFVTAMMRDITWRKHDEEVRARLAAIVEFSDDAIIGKTLEGIITSWNRAAERLFGYAAQDIVGEPITLIIPADRQDEEARILERLKRGEYIRHYETVRQCRDGRRIDVSLTISPIRDGMGKVVGVSKIARDITERRRSEAALRESNERFREITENINEVFWITDATMESILYVSPAYEKIWGRTCESLYACPQHWVEVIHPDDRERVMRAIAPERLQVGFNEIYRILRPDGAVRWIRDHAVMLRDPAGNVYRIVGVAEDITKEQKLEQQFRQAQKMEAIGTLAGGIAHDFNNILAAMCGYTELAKLKLTDNPAVRDYLDAVMHAGHRATALVRQILTFSRQQEQAERKSVKIGAVVEEALKLLRSTIPSTIEFIYSHDPDVASVLADSSQIHQIMMNLGTNAWHAMREQHGRLEVNLANFTVDQIMAEMHPRLRPGPYVRLSISDTGCGMDQTTQERIFEPFFTTKPPGEGTGLGLSVVHGIMESYDGLITVYSTLGAGTVFHLYFPAYHEVVTPPVAVGETPRGEGRRILYVDDEAPLAMLGQKTLEQLGYEVTVSTKVAEALEWVHAEPGRFDLVITDQTMPGMTGTDFAAQLLKIRPNLPIILTTGYSPYLTTARVHAMGIRDLLLKPHTLHTLGHAVHRALTEKKPD